MHSLLATLKRELGGDIAGDTLLAPAFGHSRRDRGMSITVSHDAPDGLLVNLFNGSRREAFDAKVRCLEIVGLNRLNRSRPCHQPIRLDRRPRDTRDDARRTKLALRIWDEARTPIDSPVERYLARRGLDLPDEPRDVIRFAPSCPFSGTRTRAMVALVRDAVTNAPIAVHRTTLDLAGNKIEVNGSDRLAFGPMRGGAIKLTADELVTTCLGIAEGIETALSLQLLPEFRRSPVWSLINAGGIETFPVLSGIECLWIAVDNDPAGIAAADLTSRRCRRAGREVVLVKAVEASADLNDIVEARHG